MKFIELSAIYNWYFNDILMKYTVDDITFENSTLFYILIYCSTNSFKTIEFSYDNIIKDMVILQRERILYFINHLNNLNNNYNNIIDLFIKIVKQLNNNYINIKKNKR